MFSSKKNGTTNPPNAWINLAILSSVSVLVMYAETILLPAIPDIVEDFNANYNTSSWILSGYLVAAAIATPLIGKLSDIGKWIMPSKRNTCYNCTSFDFESFNDIVANRRIIIKSK